ncbi:phage tail tape measure protein [Phocaeicola coprocola]|uniref:phage tail tape measure protein n=1 Tax=Phocaeicola coprocola TaxID=310298 RepID=UPI004026834E
MSNIFTRLLLNTDGFNKNLFQAQKNLKGFAATSKGVFGGLTQFTSYAAAFVGVSTSIHSAITANMEFEKSLSSLRSLTGVSADELNYFRTEAIRMGMDSMQSASQMVDAFKLIGSQMPELLKSKTALTQTAEAAVVLAEAAELDVPTAAKALTGALNQMGASSSEATNYINILAAASQQGSADIPYLNKAIENAGGAASSTGVKFNELVAIIEAIAPKITDAASAGTNLRNIFLTLESSTNQNLRPSVVGLSAAIDNLSKMNLDAVQLTKMFGKESVTAAIAILQEKDAFDNLSKSIKDTNTAYDQAAINNDNLSGSIGKLQSAWTSFINTMAGSNGLLKGIVDDLRDAVNWANRAMMTADEKYQYDTQDERRIAIDESNRRIQNYRNSGMTMDEALNKEIQTAKYMYPEASAYKVREKNVAKTLKEWQNASRLNINGAAYEEEQAYKEAVKLYETSKREYMMRQVIYDNVEAQRKVLVQANQEQKKAKEEAEDAAKAAKEKAAAEEAARLAKEKASRPDGSIADVDYQISQKKKEISVAISDSDRIKLNTELDELVQKKRYMDLAVQYSKPVFDTKQIADMANTKSAFSNMAKLPKGWNKIEPVPNKSVKNVESMENSLTNVSSILGSLGGLVGNASDSMTSWALNSASNIAQMIVQLQALATAQGVASAFSAPWPASLAAVATVLTTVASIFSSLPKFANGGIIGGSSYYGDKLLARVNSGEMILNKDQQKSLYQETSGSNINITSMKVRGSDIYLSLKNYMKQTGKKL